MEGIDFAFDGTFYCISVSSRRLLNLLRSTYESAVWQNRELRKVQTEAHTLNKHLEEKVTEKTASLQTEIAVRKRAEEELKKHGKRLEEAVRERTTELRKTVDLMAGREVRMAELKEVIGVLRIQLEEAGLNPVANDPLKKSVGQTAQVEEHVGL